MSSSSSAASRREKQLQELLEGKNFKQALSLCEKSIKKGDKSEQLLITKINILLAQPEQARQKQGRRELDKVLERSVPISEVSALTAIDTAANARGDRDPRIEEIWERATRVKPFAEDIYISWFKAKFWRKNWKAAQKASMLYMKNFPEKRVPFFWNIICCELAGSDPFSSELDRKILRPLAFGFLSKAAAEANTNGTLSHSRVIQNTEELILLLKIFRSQNKNEEALTVINNPRIGLGSPIGGNSWELVRQKLELYEICGRWDEEWQFCQQLLENSHPRNTQELKAPYHQLKAYGDDWKVWIGLVTAAFNTSTSVRAKLTENLILSYIKPINISRNARLALLKFYSLNVSRDSAAQDDLLSACQDYFRDYSEKSVCFRDLQSYVVCLERPKQTVFLKAIAQHCRSRIPYSTDSIAGSKEIGWITSEINALKLEYFVVVCRSDTLFHKDILEAFISNSLRLYRISLSLGSSLPVCERQPGDDAALLAVMALMHLLDLGQKNALLRCVAILEALISHSKHNYDAMLILVRLHLKFGSGWLAMEHYSRLSIKNLQHATVSWILYTRISTIHPFAPSVSRASQSPTNVAKDITLGIEWHNIASRMCNASMNQLMNDGKYNMLLDALSTDLALVNGFARFMLLTESLRIYRFTERFKSTSYPDLLDQLPQLTEETRDLTIFPSFEAPGEKKLSERLNCGPLPNASNSSSDFFLSHSYADQILKHKWLNMEIRMNQLWAFLQSKIQGLENSSADQMVKYNENERDSLTAVEIDLDNIVETLTVLCAAYHYRPPDNASRNISDSVHSLVNSLSSWYSKIAQNSHLYNSYADIFVYSLDDGFSIPDWQYFHTNFLSLDLCRLTTLALDYILSENREQRLMDPETLKVFSENIKKCIGEILSNITSIATDVQQNLRRPSSIEKLFEIAFDRPDQATDLVGQEMRKLIGVEKMREIARDMCASWIEALDGIHRLGRV